MARWHGIFAFNYLIVFFSYYLIVILDVCGVLFCDLTEDVESAEHL